MKMKNTIEDSLRHSEIKVSNFIIKEKYFPTIEKEKIPNLYNFFSTLFGIKF